MLRPIAKFILWIGGWTPVGEVPLLDKAVIIAAPHTSNWDGFWLIVYRFSMDIKLRFLAKHTLFWWPLGNILRAAGAIPIDRSFSASTVQHLVDLCAIEDHFFLALAPEGTRHWKPHWKTGFYRIASAAKIPIVLAFIDYKNKEMGIGRQIDPADPLETNLEIIREYYAQFEPRRPERMSPIKFPADRTMDDR